MIIRKSKIIFREEDMHFLKKEGIENAWNMIAAHIEKKKTPFIYDMIQLKFLIYPLYTKKSFFKLLNNIEKFYSSFVVKKKNGKERKIYAPHWRLKHVQKNINKKILCFYPVSEYAKAYIKNIQITANAVPHVNKKYLLKLDITDFFESITFGHILSNVFNKNYFPAPVGIALTKLCCCKGSLVQGAPTSPMISNLVMKNFDDYIGEWCKKQEIAYTRYCDDMTFSSDKPLYHVYYKVKKILLKMGFELNESKTRFLTKGSRQTVTGIVVNKKISISNEYKRTLRQQLYYFLKFGEDDRALLEKNITFETYYYMLLGKTAYLLSVEKDNAFFKNKKEELLIKYAENTKEHESKQDMPDFHKFKKTVLS